MLPVHIIHIYLGRLQEMQAFCLVWIVLSALGENFQAFAFHEYLAGTHFKSVA